MALLGVVRRTTLTTAQVAIQIITAMAPMVIQTSLAFMSPNRVSLKRSSPHITHFRTLSGCICRGG